MGEGPVQSLPEIVRLQERHQTMQRCIRSCRKCVGWKLRSSRFSSVPPPAIHQTISGRKRFYKYVDVVPAVDGNPGEYSISLDGRTLKTPARNPLHLPNKNIAMAIAVEWDNQADDRMGIQPVNMPMMSIASTALDQVKLDPETTINTCLKYLPTDSSLFLTNEMDRILLEKQKLNYLPVINWLNKELDTEIRTTDLMVGQIQHPESTTAKIESLLYRMDPFTLTCLQGATMESKSLILSLAYIAGFISMEQIITASRLEEEFQLEIWGVVEGGHDMDRLNNAVRLSSVGCFLSMYYDISHRKEDQWQIWVDQV